MTAFDRTPPDEFRETVDRLADISFAELASEANRTTADDDILSFDRETTLFERGEAILEHTVIRCTACDHLVDSPVNQIDHALRPLCDTETVSAPTAYDVDEDADDPFSLEYKHSWKLATFHVKCPQVEHANCILVDTSTGVVCAASDTGDEQFTITLAEQVREE